MFRRSPRKSICVASNGLVIFCIKIRINASAPRLQIQIVQALKPDDCPGRATFAEEILQRINDDNDYLKCVVFSDEASFHISGKVNKHNVRIWESQNPYEVVEKTETSQTQCLVGLMHNQIIGPCILAESTITADIYLDTLKHYVVPQFEEFQPWAVFQQDSAPPHWRWIVCDFLNETFPNRWIGRSGPTS